MGSFSGPSQPAPPDPVATAQAQAALNKETAETQARLNRINETNPYGSTTYTGTGDRDAPYLRTTEFSPGQQALYDSQLDTETKLSQLGGEITDRVAPTLATPFDISTAPTAGTAGFSGTRPELADTTQFDSSGLSARGQFDTSQLGDMPQADDATRLRVEQALMDRMRPYQERDEERLRTRLANTGFDMGSSGYNRSLDSHNRAVNDARYGAIAQGGAEQQRLFGMDMAARKQGLGEMGAQYDADTQNRAIAYGEAQDAYGRGVAEDQARFLADMQGRQQDVYEQDATFGQQNQNRERWIQEEALKRNQPLNEIAALLGTGQVQGPNFGGVPQVGVAAPDLMGATYANYQGQLQNARDAQSSRNAMMGGLFGLGSAAMMAPAGTFSDRRLKSDIQRIGTWRGYPAYSYEIFGERAVGVMSDEINQDAVIKHSSGYDMVDYSRVR